MFYDHFDLSSLPSNVQAQFVAKGRVTTSILFHTFGFNNTYSKELSLLLLLHILHIKLVLSALSADFPILTSSVLS